MAVLFFVLSALSMLVALHPFITYPLTLKLFGRRQQLLSATSGAGEAIAVCVCAYNEEAVITQKIENLLALKAAIPGTEIYVYVDAASDRTAEILLQHRDDIHVHVSDKRYGKTYGMNILVAQVKAPLILFTDANVMLDVQSVKHLPGYFSDPQVGCVCGHLSYVNEGESVTANTGSLYWRLEEKIKQLESDTGSVMGADGSVFAIRRALHTPPPADLIDDMFVSFSILCDGYRIVHAPDVRASEKSVSASAEEFRRKVRIACQAFNVHRRLWPRLRYLKPFDLYKYVSHKLLRWLVIYWLALAAVFFEAGMMELHAGLIGVGLGLLFLLALWGGMRSGMPVVLKIADILGAFAGTGLGVWRSLKGERFQTWSPAISIREGAGNPQS